MKNKLIDFTNWYLKVCKLPKRFYIENKYLIDSWEKGDSPESWTSPFDRKRVYIDMDGVLCDFYGAFRERKTDNLLYPQSKDGFFTNLKPIEGAIDAFSELEKYFDVWVLTRPSVHNPLCYTEKRLWIENHLGFETCKKLIISPDKSLLKGDFLIDDFIHEDFEGELIQFGTDKYKTWDLVLEYLIPKKDIVNGNL